MLKHIGSECLPGQNITTVPLIPENVAYGAFAPLLHARFGRTADIGEQCCNILDGSTGNESIEDEADDLSL